METDTPLVAERYLISALVEKSEVLEQLANQIKESGATPVKTETLGLRRLTFPIAKKTELELVSVFFEADPSIIKQLEGDLARNSDLKRFLLTKWSVDPNAERTSSRTRKLEKSENV